MVPRAADTRGPGALGPLALCVGAILALGPAVWLWDHSEVALGAIAGWWSACALPVVVRRRREGRWRVPLLVLSALLAVAIVEVVAWSSAAPRNGLQIDVESLYTDHPNLGFIHRPGVHREVRRVGGDTLFDEQYTIGPSGFRATPTVDPRPGS
ncbi:MAG: hypothetical protein AAGB93_16615 [Planctomycetota bacterium]